MRPVRRGFVARSSATYFVAVRPSPIPANTPNVPTVFLTMPYSPKVSRPRNLAVMTDATKLAPCETTAPTSDQTAPLANRLRNKSAIHKLRITVETPCQDPTVNRRGKESPAPRWRGGVRVSISILGIGLHAVRDHAGHIRAKPAQGGKETG